MTKPKSEATIDLFGEYPIRKASKARQVELALRRMDAAYDTIPKAMAALGVARQKSLEPERAFWQAHRELEIMSRERLTIPKAELLAAYDRRLHAGHAWWPFRKAVEDAEHWIEALQAEVKICDQIIGK